MHANTNTIHRSTPSHTRSRGLCAVASIAIAWTSLVLAACDADHPEELPLDEADVLLVDEGADESEFLPAEIVPEVEGLMAAPEAMRLQAWLEMQGYAMVSSGVELTSSHTPNAIVHFTKPGSADLIGAAIAFRLSNTGEILEVAAVIADEPDPSDPDDIATCLSPSVYHASSDAIEITMAPQENGCQIGIFGCGQCLGTGHCTLQSRQSYFWGIKFNTCDPCGGTNPNGCCGCLPGHPC